MTAVPASGRVGALPAALLARSGDSRLRRLALAAVLVLVGGTLALCCCVDGPARSGAGSDAAATSTAAGPAVRDAGADRPLGLAALGSGGAGEHAGQRVGAAETCGSPAVSGEASPATTGRAMLTAVGALGGVASSRPVSPLLAVAPTQLLDHLVAQVSPYRLCVMRT